jgi:hypothetical protein
MLTPLLGFSVGAPGAVGTSIVGVVSTTADGVCAVGCPTTAVGSPTTAVGSPTTAVGSPTTAVGAATVGVVAVGVVAVGVVTVASVGTGTAKGGGPSSVVSSVCSDLRKGVGLLADLAAPVSVRRRHSPTNNPQVMVCLCPHQNHQIPGYKIKTRPHVGSLIN